MAGNFEISIYKMTIQYCHSPEACEVAKAVEADRRRARWRMRWKPIVGARGGEGSGSRSEAREVAESLKVDEEGGSA